MTGPADGPQCELRSRVDQLRAELDQLTREQADLSATLATTGPALAALQRDTATDLGKMRAHIIELYEALDTHEKAKNPPVDWIGMSVEDARLRWPELARWVGDVLVPAYEITRAQLPDCWPLHTPVVIEMSWVRSAHVQAYLPQTHPDVTGEWHSRWLPFLLGRVKGLIDQRQCRPLLGQHRPDIGPAVVLDRPAGASADPTQTRHDLAAAEYWWPFYERAVTADLDRRRHP